MDLSHYSMDSRRKRALECNALAVDTIVYKIKMKEAFPRGFWKSLGISTKLKRRHDIAIHRRSFQTVGNRFSS